MANGWIGIVLGPRRQTFGPKSYGLHFRLTRPQDLDERFVALVREAYAVGCQERGMTHER